MHRTHAGVFAAALTLALSGMPEPDAARSAPRHPMPAAPLRALPSLDASDAVVREAIMKLGGADRLADHLADGAIIRRFVAHVDGVARGAQAPAAGVIDALERIDARPAATVYSRLYPLMQQAYEEQTRGAGYFNDRLVLAIDRVLDDPSQATPIAKARLREMRKLVASHSPG